MYPAIDQMAAFYARPLGHHASHAIRHKIHELWPSLADQRLLAYGYPLPYLKLLGRHTGSALAFMPAQMGATRWPSDGSNRVALVDADQLPLPDNSVDRIFLVHALEFQGGSRADLQELWRILAPGGRVLVVVPNRRSFWAAGEKTPFGYGEPFSRGQIARLLTAADLEVRRIEGALYYPPVAGRRMLAGLARAEKLARFMWPELAGVLLIEAEKRTFAGARLEVGRRRRPDLAPAYPEPVVRSTPSTAPSIGCDQGL